MQQAFPIRYVEPVFRPPSEAHSLILPVTDGCSWNKCSFCEMYTAPQKKFRARDEAEVLAALKGAVLGVGRHVRNLPCPAPRRQAAQSSSAATPNMLA